MMNIWEKFIKYRLYILSFSFIIFLLFNFLLLIHPIDIGLNTKIINIKHGSTPKTIATILKKNGLIKSKSMFIAYIRLMGLSQKLRAGQFKFNGKLTYKKISRILEEKEGIASLISVTIPEGFSVKNIAQLMQEKKIFKEKDFLDFTYYKAKKIFKNKYKFLEASPTLNIEGYLFPDTYTFAKGVPMKIVVDQMLKRFDDKIYTLWIKSKKPYNLNLHQALTLASIIQKEAYYKKEMPIIASVFFNRLKKQMYLASCPTVLFAIGDPNKKRLIYKDLEIKSPYNTYKRKGLPPTPISSPGILAFQAVLNPAKTNYLYFVSKHNGLHAFSTNLKDHNKKKKLYIR